MGEGSRLTALPNVFKGRTKRQTFLAPEESIYQLSVEQYHAMVRSGILTADDAIELLEGWLVEKVSKNPRHRMVMVLLAQLLYRIVPPNWHIESQDPITLADSEPEPDFAIIRGAPTDYPVDHPGAQAVALVIELSDATYRRDSGQKKRIYARAGIPIYWLINLNENQVEVYSTPVAHTEEPDYRRRQVYGQSDLIPLILDEQVITHITVADFMPKPKQ